MSRRTTLSRRSAPSTFATHRVSHVHDHGGFASIAARAFRRSSVAIRISVHVFRLPGASPPPHIRVSHLLRCAASSSASILDTGRAFRDAQARDMAEAHTGDARIAMREHASGPSVNSIVNSWDEGEEPRRPRPWRWCLKCKAESWTVR